MNQPRRGDIYWACMGEPRGSEPGYRRPVLVISANEFNQSAIHTVTVVALTSNLRLAAAPGNVALTPRQSQLTRESVVNVSQVLILDKQFLAERVSSLPAAKMALVDQGLRLSLNL